MGRAKRSSKSSKTAKNLQNVNSATPDGEEQPSSRRKSLRSSTKTSLSSAKASLDSATVHVPPAPTRSSRKRPSVSAEDCLEDQKLTPQVERVAKRRGVTEPAPPSPDICQNASAPMSVSGRKRRGVETDSSNPSLLLSVSAAKRAKISPGAGIATSSPVPSSKVRSSTVLKRRYHREFSSESDTNQTEQEEDEQKSDHSQSSSTKSVRKRGAKRRRKAPKKTTSANKSASSSKRKPTASKPSPKTKQEDVKEIIVNSDSERSESRDKSNIKTELTHPAKPKECELSPMTKQEIEVLQRRQLFSRLNHDDLSDLTASSNCAFSHSFSPTMSSSSHPESSVALVLNNWPELELRNQMAISSGAFSIPASYRLWISKETSSANPQLMHENVNGDGHYQTSLDTEDFMDLISAPSVKRARRSISMESNGCLGGGGGELLLPGKLSAAEVDATDELRSRLLGTFCVAFFSISLPDGKSLEF